MADQSVAPGASGSVSSVVEQLDALTTRDRLTLRDIVEGFGETSIVAVMMVPALLVISPLSGIPVFSSLCGITIALVAFQMLVGRTHLWLPNWLMRRELSGARVHRALAGVRGPAGWLDRRAGHRLTPLISTPFDVLPKALCVICGLSMPFLELLPFSSTLLGTAVVLFAAGFLTRDGVFPVLGCVVVAVAAAIPLTALTYLQNS